MERPIRDRSTRCSSRTWLIARLRLGRDDGGFILLESLIAITVITVVMSAVGVQFVGGLVAASQQRAQQTAVQLADSTVEQLRSLAASDLVTGRGSDSVTEQFGRATPRVQPWLTNMEPAFDSAAPRDRGSDAAVPTVGVMTHRARGPAYEVNEYLGWCSNRATSLPAQPTGYECLKTPAPASGSPARYLRVVVAVTWHGQGCPVDTESVPVAPPCSYVTSTMVSASTDPIYQVNDPVYPAAVVAGPSHLTNAIGDTGVRVPMTVRSGGVPPFTWAVSSGALPTGLMLNPATGLISGTVQGPVGDYSPQVQVTDAFLRPATLDVSWTVKAALTYTPSTSRSNPAGTALTVRLDPTGGEGAPYTFTDPTSSLPSGLTLSNDGLITGTPTTIGTFPVSLRLGDSSGARFTTRGFTWTVTQPPLAAVTPTAQTSTVSTAVRGLQLTATGGTGTYRWSDATPASLPPGLSLDTVTGAVTGSPTTVGTSAVKLTVSDDSTSKTVSFSWRVLAAPTVAAPADRASSVGSVARLQLTQLCPNLPCTDEFGGPAPSGLSVSGTGLITGTIGSPAQTYAGVTVVVTDASGATSTSAPFSWTVNRAPTISSPGNQTTLRAKAVSLDLSTLVAEGSPPYTFTAAGLPAWLKLSAGKISGTAPTTNSTTTGITVTVSDSSGVSVTSPAFWWNVTNLAGSLTSQTVTTSSPVSANLNTTTSGGTSPYSFSASGLPSWLRLDPGTGEVKGTSPTVPADTSVATPPVAVTVLDDVGASITLPPFSWYVTDMAWTGPSTYSNKRNDKVVFSVSALPTGGASGKAFSAVGLPTGLTMSSTGVISGIAGTVGVFTGTLSVTDSVGATVSTPVRWTVS